MKNKGLVKTFFFILLLALSAKAFQSHTPSQDSKYGTLYFPLPNGRLAFMSADCLITDSKCPEPKSTWFPVRASQWTTLSWSPDGTKAFVVVAGNKSDSIGVEEDDELFLLNPKTYSLKSLILMSYINDASWSPDGKWLAVAGVKEGHDAATTDVQIALSEIFIISPDGKSIVNLTDGLHGMKLHLSWLDQDTILFEVDDYPNGCGTYSFDIHEKTWVSLLEKPDCYTFPQPSPDGKLIAYGGVKGDNDNELFMMNSDGTDKTLLAELDTLSVRPVWSPNQEWIRLDTIDKRINSSIFIIFPDGTGLQNVYQSENFARVAWAPINESYLLISEFDQGSVSKLLGIKIPDGKVRILSIFDENHPPHWVSWRPPLSTISNP